MTLNTLFIFKIHSLTMPWIKEFQNFPFVLSLPLSALHLSFFLSLSFSLPFISRRIVSLSSSLTHSREDQRDAAEIFAIKIARHGERERGGGRERERETELKEF